MATSTQKLILIAGPYRSGTDDDSVAPTVLRSAGAGPNDPLAQKPLDPTAELLLDRCDTVLRPPGASTGADQDVAISECMGLPVHCDIAEIPTVQEQIE